jgi:hypothetical protein
MSRLMRLILLLTVLVGVTPLSPARAQEAAPAALPALTVGRNEAVADFPTGITFTLDAETTAPITNLELMYRPPGIDTFSVELPPFDAGTTKLAIEHPIDLRDGHLPPGIDVNYRWRITEENGDVVETPEQTVLWADDRYDWTPLTGQHVTVYSYENDPTFQKEILDTAERTITRLADSYGVTPDQPIRIWAYASKDDLYGALAPNSDPWIGGANYPSVHVIVAILPAGSDNSVSMYVPHEMSHQVLYQATKNPFNAPPQWLDEGLAVYTQETGRDRFYTHALELAASGKVPPLRTLNGDFPYDANGALAGYSYSLSVVMYILDTWGNEGLSKLIAAFPAGVTFDQAVQQGLGISFDELDRRWRDDLVADAQRLGVAGSTRFGDSDPGAPSIWSPLGRALALASGTLILGLVVLIAVVAGVVSLLRARRRRAPEEEFDPSGVMWREWPEGLEPH